jgi:hypothetical protein
MSDDSLSHLDDRLAADFAEVGWRPAERGSSSAAPAEPRQQTVVSAVATVLRDMVVRIDSLERRLDERNAGLQAIVDEGWAKMETRLAELEAALVPARMAAETLLARLAGTVESLEQRAGGDDVTTAVQELRASMRAQSRVLEALYDMTTRVDDALRARTGD